MSGGKRLQQFQQDIEDISAHHADGAGIDVALRFVDDLETLIDRLAEHPALGSARYADLGIPEVRSKAMTGLPYVLFYARAADQVVFWRILHGHRDIPATLHESAEPRTPEI